MFIYLKCGGVTQWVKQLTLELSSGLDFRVVGSGPALGSALGVQPTLEIKQYGTLTLEQAPCSWCSWSRETSELSHTHDTTAKTALIHTPSTGSLRRSKWTIRTASLHYWYWSWSLRKKHLPGGVESGKAFKAEDRVVELKVSKGCDLL